MKTLCLLLLLNFGFSFAQEHNHLKIFSKFELGIYGGINFEEISNLGSIFIFEGRTNLTSKINMKLSLGYSKFSNPKSYNFQTYQFSNIENIKKYISISYNVSEIKYQVIPFSLGLQYIFACNLFSPYLQIETTYNLIDPLTIKENYKRINEYDSYGALPANFKKKDKLPVSSFGLSFGIGTKYKISPKLIIDIRYLYQIDSELSNRHILLIGLTI